MYTIWWWNFWQNINICKLVFANNVEALITEVVSVTVQLRVGDSSSPNPAYPSVHRWFYPDLSLGTSSIIINKLDVANNDHNCVSVMY